MKWIFSFLLFSIVVGNLDAREIVLITYGHQNDRFKNEIQKIVQQQLKIPPSFLTWRKTARPCQAEGKPLLQICLVGKDFKVVQSQTALLKRTLGKIVKPAVK